MRADEGHVGGGVELIELESIVEVVGGGVGAGRGEVQGVGGQACGGRQAGCPFRAVAPVS